MPKRVDANQPEIVQSLRAVGAKVAITSDLGKGFPDLVVGFRNQTFMLEIKDGAKPPSRRKLTPDEQQFHAWWEGGPLVIVNNADEALAAIGAVTYKTERS